ncbi:tetratricopeptide repeat protein [Actinosynnema pretiosum]|uniref:tetratricopeptide repeat protein n=1 Tax=Actinosynnema pretiosum TaxID=42197 RepID=UPI0012FDAB4D|nr:tetratricopeptide repeat protein [Actinosynnema pretiosum]
MPATTRHFVGRDAEVARLTELAGAGGACVVEGLPGVGKSTLVTAWAHSVADALFPDGQIHLNLHGFAPGRSPVTAEQATHSLLSALRVPVAEIPPDPEDRMALFRDLVHDLALLLVLDNARDSAQVETLLPRGRPFTVVTSRRSLTALRAGCGVETLRLAPMSRAESLGLLARHLGADALDDPAVAELARRCADLPLALSIVAASVSQHPGVDRAAFAWGLAEDGALLASLALDSATADWQAVVNASYRLLPDPAARALRLLALHPGDTFDARAAAALCGTGASGAEAVLRELLSHHLLEAEGARYRFHDLLRVFARDRLAEEEDAGTRERAAEALLDHLLHSAFHADRLVNAHRTPIALGPPPQAPLARTPDPGPPDRRAAVDWLVAELPALVASTRLAADHGRLEHAWKIPWAAVNAFQLRGRWQDWIDSHVVALRATEELGDVGAENRTLRALARAYDEAGRSEEAVPCFTRALANCERAGDDNGRANCLNGRAGSLLRAGRAEEALRDARAALEVHAGRDDLIGRASTTNLLGRVHTALGAPRLGVALHGRALRLFRTAGDRYGQAQAIDAMGRAMTALGRPGSAAVCHRVAVDVHEEVGNHAHAVLSRGLLADALTGAGGGTLAADRCGRLSADG